LKLETLKMSSFGQHYSGGGSSFHQSHHQNFVGNQLSPSLPLGGGGGSAHNQFHGSSDRHHAHTFNNSASAGGTTN
jgi:hypothetical protein